MDDGFSASNPAVYRPAFHRAITELRDDPEVLALYAWRTERLARRHIDGEALMESIETAAKSKRSTLTGDRTSAYLKTVQDGIDTRSRGGKDWLRQTVDFGKREADAMSDRAKRGKAEKREAGRFAGSPPAFGHRDGTRWAEIDPADAAAIREAARRVIKDGVGVMEILRDWRDREITTRRGNQWQHVAWIRMVTAGGWPGCDFMPGTDGAPDVEYRDGDIAPILDEDTWRALRAILLDPRRKPSDRHNGRPRHLLTNLLMCSECLGTLRAKGNAGRWNGPGYWTYGCTRDSAHPLACGRVWIKGAPTDAYVEQIVLALLRSHDARRAMDRRTASATALDDRGTYPSRGGRTPRTDLRGRAVGAGRYTRGRPWRQSGRLPTVALGPAGAAQRDGAAPGAIAAQARWSTHGRSRGTLGVCKSRHQTLGHRRDIARDQGPPSGVYTCVSAALGQGAYRHPAPRRVPPGGVVQERAHKCRATRSAVSSGRRISAPSNNRSET